MHLQGAGAGAEHEEEQVMVLPKHADMTVNELFAEIRTLENKLLAKETVIKAQKASLDAFRAKRQPYQKRSAKLYDVPKLSLIHI